jgi:hypothetical protein
MYVAQDAPERGVKAGQSALRLARVIGDRRFEGYAQQVLGLAYAALDNVDSAHSAFTETLAIFQEIGDRHGEAICRWEFGLALAGWGEQERAVRLLRGAVAYKQEIGHSQAMEHAALLARLEAGEPLSAEPLFTNRRRAVGQDTIPPGHADADDEISLG